MPLGWYLAQGLIPIGPSSSDDEEGPCELPDGRLVCGPHGFVICHKCCSDYSFMEDVLDDEGGEGEGEGEDEDEDGEVDEHDEEAKRRFLEIFFGDQVPLPNQHVQWRGPSDRGPSPLRMGTVFVPVSSSPTTTDEDMPDLLPGPMELEKRRGTGRVFPSRFIPPSGVVDPTMLFSGNAGNAHLIRYTMPRDPSWVLVFTDGACLNNGQANPKAGWAFVHGRDVASRPIITAGRLENEGPFGDPSIQSSNRAELRAVIATLRSQPWGDEGFETIVIATDSEYVAEGATAWVRTWVRNGWRRNSGGAVKNRDLWEMLLGEVERWHDRGLSIQFWRIPRACNEVADRAAKKAAEQMETKSKWVDI